jgi:hypothetical protein
MKPRAQEPRASPEDAKRLCQGHRFEKGGLRRYLTLLNLLLCTTYSEYALHFLPQALLQERMAECLRFRAPLVLPVHLFSQCRGLFPLSDTVSDFDLGGA